MSERFALDRAQLVAKLTDEPLDEPPVRLVAEWQRRELNANARHVLPVGGSIEVRAH